MADEIRPTPRSPIFGLFSDLVNVPLQYMTSPQRTQQMQRIGGLFSDAAARAAMHRDLIGQEAAYTQQAMRAGRLTDALRGGPAGAQLDKAIADAYNPAGITVYHGSPHRFTKFDASKIGTGEGAQAYGHGIYVAESPGVAKAYKNVLSQGKAPVEITLDGAPFPVPKINFSNPDPKQQQLARLRTLLMQEGGDVDAAIARTYGDDAKALEAFRGRVSVGEPGSLYKVDLPDEHIARMLDWDKPLHKQSPFVQEAVRGLVDDTVGTGTYAQWIRSRPDFKGLQNDILDEMSNAQISEALSNRGIPGIRYLDANSRSQGKGTSNFVIFPGNEDFLRILSVNGEEIANPIMYSDPFRSSVR